MSTTIPAQHTNPNPSSKAQQNQVRTTSSKKKWKASPSLQDAATGKSLVRYGHKGQSVKQLQRLLQDQGHSIKADGYFGSDTKRAVRDFQRDQKCRPDGIVGPQTMSALRSTSEKSDFVPSHKQEQRQKAHRATGKEPNLRAPVAKAHPQPAPAVKSGIPKTTALPDKPKEAAQVELQKPVASPDADARLKSFQDASVTSARQELANGVRENPRLGRNRGQRIDNYARTAGMNKGGEWCGYFTSFNYTQAAKAAGAKFTGQKRMHSYQKARSYFMYRSYTNNKKSTVAKYEQLRQEHKMQGSERRYMTFDGSKGDQHAKRYKLTHEVYQSPSQLPIRAGDTALFGAGHVGMVESYNAKTGLLTTIEGNVGYGPDGVHRRTYDLNNPKVRARFDGFGRPAAGDFVDSDSKA
jgi:peptidoglycan hydrolase-like protein with peptidoglycan-binding domain